MGSLSTLAEDWPTIKALATALGLTLSSELWWRSPQITDAIEAGVAKGWAWRGSVTQAQWTEEGARLFVELRSQQTAKAAKEIEDDQESN